MTKAQQVARIAFRVEGHMWNAYVAKLDTMEGAHLIGSIAMRVVEDRPERKKQFMDMMQEVFSDISEELLGARATYPDGVQRAPEHERAGRA